MYSLQIIYDISIFEHNSSLNQTGKAFSTQVLNNTGAFEINGIELNSPYIELLAIGYYYNEVSGKISPTPILLYAISDIKKHSTVNCNLLTHLEKQRSLEIR